jgi:methionyl-tRNA formyltransferase
MKIAVTDGYLFLDEVQLSGKKRLDIVSLLNGFRLAIDAKIL